MGLGEISIWFLEKVIDGVICGLVCATIHYLIEHKRRK